MKDIFSCELAVLSNRHDDNLTTFYQTKKVSKVLFGFSDADSDAGPRHQDATSGAESCGHALPARLHPAAAPGHCHHGDHRHLQTRRAQCPHQPASGGQTKRSQFGTTEARFQERHAGKSACVRACVRVNDLT